MYTLSDLVDRTTQLFSLPDAYLRLQDILADPDYDLDDVVAVVANDPGLTASLLRIANSAFFGLPSRVTSVNRAVSLLGVQQVHDLLLAQALSGVFSDSDDGSFDMYRFWYRSVYCGCLARVLARRCHVLDSERLFVYGLLHDIGHMVLYQRVPGLAAEALAHAIEQAVPLHLAEEAIIGCNHADVGAELCRRWRLPEALWMTLRHHPRPRQAGKLLMESCIVHIGAALAACSDPRRLRAPGQMDPVAWQTLQLGPDCLPGVRAEAQVEADKAMELFFGQMRRTA